MHLFYTPDIKGNTYTLSPTESKHCTKVLRLTKGDTIHLIDGVGGLYTTEIIDDSSKACQVKCINVIREYQKRNFKLHIGIAPTKNNDRTEWFLEKCTEMGIDNITPVLCEHSERKVVKIERLNKIITSAIKQSLKAYHPELEELIKFKNFINQDFEGQKFIAHCNHENKTPLQDIYKKNNNVLILIGPEGDFSTQEVEMAKRAGFKEISLGNSRLRTETAGIVACHTINLINRT